jgi:hypothetical protein
MDLLKAGILGLALIKTHRAHLIVRNLNQMDLQARLSFYNHNAKGWY